MSDLSLPQLIAAASLPLLFAITVHEVAHGWMAKRLGDPTAERLGRLTLNPIKHIDPLGTILFPLLLLLASGGRFAFGYAKPVPVNWENLRYPKRDMAIVAAAGPGANLLMAVGWALIARIGYALEEAVPWMALPLATMGEFGIVINAVLLVLNLLPLPPLDGGRVAVGLLPGPLAWQLSRLEPYGFWILLILLITGALAFIINPPIAYLANAIAAVMGLPQLL